MNTDYTALALVVDRSGSMHSVASDVKGSVKQFIGDQKKNPGKASLTVSQFDHEYEVIHNFKELSEVDEEAFANGYSPRGSTALLDAIGRATIEMAQKVQSMPEADQPKRVVVAIITDGLENASTDFTLEKIRDMIKEKEELGWDFIFMGATLDTIDIAKNMGFSPKRSAVYDASNVKTCMQSISDMITSARLNKEVEISQEERDRLASTAPAS